MGQKPQFTKVAKGSSVRDSSGKEAAAEPLRRNYVWPYQADRERILVCGAARAVEKGLGSKSEWLAPDLLHMNCRTVPGKSLNYLGLFPSSVNTASLYYEDPGYLQGLLNPLATNSDMA